MDISMPDNRDARETREMNYCLAERRDAVERMRANGEYAAAARLEARITAIELEVRGADSRYLEMRDRRAELGD